MNNEEIIKAVKNSLNIYSFTAEALELLIDNAKKEAREACAKVCDEQFKKYGCVADKCAAAIRARSTKE